MKELILYGAGGHCYAVVELIRSLQHFQPKAIVDPNPKEKSILDILVYTSEKDMNLNAPACIAIGDNSIRKKLAERLHQDFPSFVHDSVVRYPSVTIGTGTVVFPNVVLDAAVRVGDFCIINNSAVVSHNGAIGDHAHASIKASLAGGVTIGEGTLVGAGSIINPELTIGKWAIIGSGAVVTKNVPDFAVVYGNPARIIRHTKNES